MHALDICFSIAAKMKNPKEVVASMNEKIKNGQSAFLDEWPDLSLASGISGIICFYAFMNLHFPNEGWEKVIHEYLLLTKERIEAVSADDLSLFYGLAGLSTAVHFCSNQGQRYKKMLSSLDDLLLREVPFVYLKMIDHYLDPQVPIPSNFYNLSFGLSGIIAYCLLREDNFDLKNLAQESLCALIKLLSGMKEVDGLSVPAWYLSSEHESIFYFNGKRLKGGFKLDSPNGLPGVLALLSLAKMRGYHALGLTELISRIADWIQSKKIIQGENIHWNRHLFIEEELERMERDPSFDAVSGIYGDVAILRNLYFASKAVQNHDLEKFAVQTFLSKLRERNSENELEDSSLSFGQAGLLAMTSEMACTTQNPEFFKHVRLFEEEIKRRYHPNHEFGYQIFLYDRKGNYQKVDNPTLMEGSAGIALTLLQAQKQQEATRMTSLIIA